jgi:NTE family protein
MKPMNTSSIALVLSGGGARGAYQVGVIQALGSLFDDWGIQSPFPIYSGVSAGAINASFMASQAEDFSVGAKQLVDLWSQLSSDQIFRTDALSLGKIGFQWAQELSIGSLTGSTPGKALLDTSPLRKLIEDKLELHKISRNIEMKKLKALAITALDYRDSTAVTFLESNHEFKHWAKPRKVSEEARITVDHIMASSAIPLLFPPILASGRYFGDGCVRNTHPCGPAIYMGAQKLVIVGVRSQNTTAYDAHALLEKKPPSTARVMNVLLNSVLLDGVDLDVERIKKVNEMVHWIPEDQKDNVPYKAVEYVWISPSRDIGALASEKSRSLPRLIRFLIKNLGSIEEASEIISYLLFEKVFTTELIEMGFEDGMKAKDQLKKMFQV